MNPFNRFKTALLIYQLEDYSLRRWMRWWWEHPLTSLEFTKKNIMWTARLRLVVGLGFLLWLVLLVGLLNVSYYSGGLFLVATVLLPALPLVLGGLSALPLDWWVVEKRKKASQRLLEGQKDLIKVGITGSYGKTSVKEMLFAILDRHGYTLTTPDNFNTVGGIHRTLANEISSKHRYFIAEMGAYYPGDIRKLCELVAPDWGILTSVGPQHLERFGTVETIAQTKTELVRFFKKKQTVVNWDSKPLQDYLVATGLETLVWKVSKIDDSADFVIEKITFTEKGSEFVLKHSGKRIKISTPLFGTASVINSALAAALALLLQVPVETITRALSQALPIPHRLQLSKLNRATLLDNTYSSNFDSFMSLMDDLETTKGKKIVLTPGVVELGVKEELYHVQLGQRMAKVFDEVFLVGNSVKTLAIEKGLRQSKYVVKVTYIPNTYDDYWKVIGDVSKKADWVVLENDLPEHYS